MAYCASGASLGTISASVEGLGDCSLQDIVQELDMSFQPRTGSKMSNNSVAKRIVILANGTRGDVQPFIALGARLDASGFEVLVCCNSDHVAFLREFGLEATGVHPDIEKILENPSMKEFMETGDFKHLTKYGEETKEQVKIDFADSLDLQYKAIKEFKPVLLISTNLDSFAGVIFGRLFQLPVINCGLQPQKPTKYVKTALNEPVFSYTMWRIVLRFIYNDLVERKLPIVFEKFGSKLGNDLIWSDFKSYMYDVMNPIAPELIGVSPAVLLRPRDWAKSLDPVLCTGYWVIGRDQQLQQLQRKSRSFGGCREALELERFVLAGERPVYMGWGSMTVGSAKAMTCLAVRSLKLAGVRGVIMGGWAKLDASLLKGEPDEQELEEYISGRVLFVDAAPHEWLFPICAATVHHGGAGTTASALRSGNPTIITPCFLDQFASAQMVAKSGCGVAMPQFKKVTPTSLSKAIRRCCTDMKMQLKARQMAETLLSEDGLGRAVELINDFLEGDLASGSWRARFEERRRQNLKVEADTAPLSPCCFVWHQAARARPQRCQGTRSPDTCEDAVGLLDKV